MTDDTDEIELPRYARPIGVARGTVAGPWAANSTGATDSGPSGASARSIGVLSPFAGLLNPAVEPGGHPGPAFSYLALRPLVVERVLERESETVREGSAPGEPGRPGATGELRVRHVLRADQAASPDRPSAGTDRRPTDDPRPVPRAEPDDPLAPGRGVTDADSGERGSNDAGVAEGATERIRDVTVLGDGHLTVLERPTVDAPSPFGRTRGTAADQDRDSTRGTRPAVGKPEATTDPLTLPPPPMVAAVTDPTVDRPARSPAVPRGGPVELRVALPGRTTAGSTGDGPRGTGGRRTAAGSRGDASSEVARTGPGGPEGSPAERRPDLTVVTARPGPGTGESQRFGDDGARGPGSDGPQAGVRAAPNGTPLDGDGTRLDAAGDRPPGRTGREGPERRSGQETTMAALLDDTTEMNRLVDRLYREFQRKTRIERERRGL